ncbi:MAG: Spy/CpxP family protein refolding chaperone [Gemmatimonadaceae bacterium]
MSRFNAAALGAALLIGISGVAGAQTPGTQGPSVKAPGEKGMDGHRRGGVRGEGMRGGRRGGRGFDRGVARDLNLTEAQRTQIRAIHEKYRPRIQTIHEQFKSQNDAARALRQNGDTAGARTAFQRLHTDMQARLQPIHQQQQTEIRNLLTAEQRTKFDAAQLRMKERMQNRDNDGRGKAGRYRPAQRS